jgi:large subunit ribosomal protein L4
MPQVKVQAMDGTMQGECELPPSVFGIEPNPSAVHQTIVAYLANQRRGTASTKGRSDVAGSAHKPWRQKGTGRARAGTRTSPLWIGGGTTFGPKPRDHSVSIPQKVRRLALKSVLSDKATAGKIHCLDQLTFEEPKTRRLQEILTMLGIGQEKTLIVISDPNMNLYKSSSNMPLVNVRRAREICAYDVLNADVLVFTRDALDAIEEVFAP